ncbi:MAG TPA: 30S ribosomal protein S24e [Thermoplasmata archaeon]|nr:30S ribosomal protein S24e [Thermoplasmata archaeon]
MEIKIIEERTNPLLKRHEVRFEVAHATAATPTRESVRTELAKAVHASKDRVVIERMRARFGTAVTRGEANVYENVEAAKSISREHILVRNGLKEKAAKGATPAPAETPAPGATPEPAKEKASAPETVAPPPAPAPAPSSSPEPYGEGAKKTPKPHAKKE